MFIVALDDTCLGLIRFFGSVFLMMGHELPKETGCTLALSFDEWLRKTLKRKLSRLD
jgi:hypothetical protein